MENKNELYNAKKGLEGFDPTLAKNDLAMRNLILDRGYSQAEWEEYHGAKIECENNGLIWPEERNEKHEKMAIAYKMALKELDEID